jgi:hypothetical protein
VAKPTTREAFKDHCLRRLGWPVIEINVDDDQVDDRVDEALEYFQLTTRATVTYHLPKM